MALATREDESEQNRTLPGVCSGIECHPPQNDEIGKSSRTIGQPRERHFWQSPCGICVSVERIRGSLLLFDDLIFWAPLRRPLVVPNVRAAFELSKVTICKVQPLNKAAEAINTGALQIETGLYD